MHREIERGLKIPDEPAIFGVSDTQERPIVETERSWIQVLSLEVIFVFSPVGLWQSWMRLWLRPRWQDLCYKNAQFTSLPWEAELQIPLRVQPALPNNEALGSFEGSWPLEQIIQGNLIS